MKNAIHRYSLIVFGLTALLYGITISSVPYVGVYLTYVAVPVIVVSGLLAYMTRPKDIIQKFERL
jgi:hypothetical protein